MSISRRSSNASAPCRFEWRPSRWLASALALLGTLGAFAAIASDMPPVAALMLGMAVAFGGACSAVHEARRPNLRLAWSPDGTLAIDGKGVDGVSLQWRGPLAFLRWRDAGGRRHSVAWLPDTLDRATRRELRLAQARIVSAASRPSMAP